MSVGPKEQASSVARAAVNWRGHMNNIADLVAKGKRPAAELAELQRWLPGLDAANRRPRHSVGRANRSDAAMSVTLSDTQYGTLWRALVRIAHGRRGVNHQRLYKDDLVTLAREACDVVGWPYSEAAIAAIDKPQFSGHAGAKAQVQQPVTSLDRNA